jgi:hypothetical protein
VLGRRDEAEAVLRQTLAVAPRDPLAMHALGTTLLAQGRYGEAGPYYEARFAVPQLRLVKPRIGFPEWRGEDLAGKRLLIYPEMGFGDQIQHARFAALLRDRGAEVQLFCRAGLARLFAGSLPGVAVAATEGRVELPDPDCWVMSASLMSLLDLASQTLPNAPYLHAPPAERPPPPGFKIGLMAAGDPTHPNDANRSLPAELAARLRAALPGQVVDLAPAATGARDFADTAALIAGLDLVVSVDTAAAHLAGALGKRAFVLIPAINTDWRWMHERTDSPWYPSLTLYRADAKRGWAAALEQLVADARTMAAAHG